MLPQMNNNQPAPSFSAWISFEELLKDERSCAQEVAAYDKKIENWSVSTKSEPKPRAASTVQVCVFTVILMNNKSWRQLQSFAHCDLSHSLGLTL